MLKNRKYFDLLGIFIIVLVFALLVASRAFAYIYDEYCPTHPMNFIEQIRSGIYPGTFPGAPNVAANYHQGTFLVSAYLGEAFNIGSAEALKIALIIASFFLAIFLLLGMPKNIPIKNIFNGYVFL